MHVAESEGGSPGVYVHIYRSQAAAVSAGAAGRTAGPAAAALATFGRPASQTQVTGTMLRSLGKSPARILSTGKDTERQGTVKVVETSTLFLGRRWWWLRRALLP